MNEQPERSTGAAPMTRLLRTKLFVPQVHADVIARPRLLQLLDDGLRRKLILVSAPAGFGKTTALSTWIAQSGVPVAWVSLDRRDNDPMRFWAYVVAALQTLRSGIGETALAMLQSPQPPPLETILTELLNEVALMPVVTDAPSTAENGSGRGFLLVLDDYHTIDQPAIHEAVTFLLENLPPQMHLAIAGRTDPPLPLPLLRARRELAEVRQADLRFTAEETADFLNRVMGLDLTPADIAALEAATEGWIAGLQLAALSMQGMEDTAGFIRSFSRGHRFVFDYLAQEILNHQPEEVRQFLLQTAILDQMCAPLCDAVCDCQDGQAMLERLEQANLFLEPLDQQRQWYRYHHLFAEFLRARLEQEYAPADVAERHRRASAWYTEHRLIVEAVDHALAAKDDEQAARLIAQFAGDIFYHSELRTLVRWMEMLPAELISANPTLSLAYAWTLVALGQPQAAEQCLQDVEHVLGATADGSPASLALPPEVRGPLGEISCVRATIAFGQIDLARVVAMSRQTQAYFTDDVGAGAFNTPQSLRAVVAFNLGLAYEFSGDVLAAGDMLAEALALSQADENLHLTPMVHSHLAQLQMVRGQLRQAAETYRSALRSVEEGPARPSPFSGMAYTGIGNLLYEWNDLDRATDSLTRGIERARQWGNLEILVPGYLGLAQIKIARGDVDGAFAAIEGLVDYSRQVQGHWAIPLIEATRAILQARRGDLDAAGRWVQQCKLNVDSDLSYFAESELLILARLLCVLGDPDSAVRLTGRLLAAAEAGERRGRVIGTLVVQALVLQAQQRHAEALAALERALTLAEPEGYVRTFIDEGAPMATLLQAISRQPSSAARDYAAKLLASLEPGRPKAAPRPEDRATAPASQPRPGTPVEPLTEREVEVLRLLADGRTNREIADTLVVTVNTVKTHMKNINSKLGTRNRTEAAARAHELGLHP